MPQPGRVEFAAAGRAQERRWVERMPVAAGMLYGPSPRHTRPAPRRIPSAGAWDIHQPQRATGGARVIRQYRVASVRVLTDYCTHIVTDNNHCGAGFRVRCRHARLCVGRSCNAEHQRQAQARVSLSEHVPLVTRKAAPRRRDTLGLLQYCPKARLGHRTAGHSELAYLEQVDYGCPTGRNLALIPGNCTSGEMVMQRVVAKDGVRATPCSVGRRVP
jgi:hypothetical protein